MRSAVTLTLDDATLTALDAIAESRSESRDAVVSRAIADLKALDDWQTARIQAGLAAAERGDFASDEEVARVRAKFRASA